jgi:hypothetical protein
MNWGTEDRAEWAVDVAAAAFFAVAVGFALWAVASGAGTATVAAAAAFLAALFWLRQIKPGMRTHALPDFPVETIEPMPETRSEAVDELILEDELSEVSPHARVVRLFGPSQSHLHTSHSRSAPPDASQALSEALAELRRSLR